MKSSPSVFRRPRPDNETIAPVTIFDAQGRVVYSSPAGKRMLGYAPGFWMGHNVFELVHPDDAPRVTEVFARALATPGLTDPVQFRMRHADGAWRFEMSR